jgi:hypothetical protein
VHSDLWSSHQCKMDGPQEIPDPPPVLPLTGGGGGGGGGGGVRHDV